MVGRRQCPHSLSLCRTSAGALAKELVALQPDVILAHSDPISTALQRESRAIPIVFVGISDPVAAGFVASLPRPGGNLTGLMQFEASITGKWLAMLKEIAPRLARAALVKNTKTNDYEHFMRAAEGVAPSLAIELVSSHVEKPADIARAIESLARVPDGGLVVLPDPTTLVHRDLIIALAARYRLPAVYSGRHFVVAGGLMSYGINRVDEFRQAASYVDRILRGDKPADLPVLAPTKYETVLSLIAPGAARFAALVNPSDPTAEFVIRNVQAGASAIGRQIEVFTAGSNRDISTAFANIVQKRIDALVVSPDPLFGSHRVQLAVLAARHAIPAIYSDRQYAVAGGLMSYGTSLAEQYRQVGIYTGRVLRGERPTDLPVMRATKFEFIINLQTAEALGLTVPATLLARADEVIE